MTPKYPPPPRPNWGPEPWPEPGPTWVLPLLGGVLAGLLLWLLWRHRRRQRQAARARREAVPTRGNPEVISSGNALAEVRFSGHWTEQVRAILMERFDPRAAAWTTEEIAARRDELTARWGTDAVDELIAVARLADGVKFAGETLDQATVTWAEQRIQMLRRSLPVARGGAPE